MSSRPLLRPQKVMNNLLANQNLESLVTNTNMISMASYSIKWGADVTGTFEVQVCNDYIEPVGVQPDQLAAGTWVTVPLTIPVVASGSADDAFIGVVLNGSAYVKLVFIDGSGGSGTGLINATIAGKVT